MKPNVSVISQAAKRNNISLSDIANSIFGNRAEEFIDFLKNPHNINFIIKYKDLSKIANKLHIPFGYLFLEKLPKENLKIAQLRRKNLDLPMSNILKESIKNSEYKQLWHRDYLIAKGQKANFVKKYNNKEEIIKTIKNITKFNELPKDSRKAIYQLSNNLQEKNILVFIASSIDRKFKNKNIDIEDCRGYCIYDSYTPVIFLNNTDSYSAKIFTILHELAHILYGESSIITNDNQDEKMEKLCNEIAGEILIPTKFILGKWDKNKEIEENIEAIKKECLASKEAIATKAVNLKIISNEKYDEYKKNLNIALDKKPFTRNSKLKISRMIIKENSENFTKAILTQTLNNNLDFNSALRYLGIEKMEYFNLIRKELKI